MASHRIAARTPRGRTVDTDVRTDAETISAVLEDAAHYPGGHAAGVARPATEADVAALIAGASRVLPIGAQSSLTGGATPMGDLVLDLQRFDRIVAIGADEVVVQPGAPIGTLQAALARDGRFYPPAPTFDGACAGGVVATNAAGAATFKYGTTRDWVRRLTVVLATGDVLDLTRGETTAHPDGWFEVVTGAKTIRVPAPSYRMPDVPKCSAGYFAAPGMDLVDLFIGSEGTLGVVTEVTFAVVAPAPRVAMVWITLSSERAATDLTRRLRTAAHDARRHGAARGVDVASIEHLDARSLEIVREDGAARRHQVAAARRRAGGPAGAGRAAGRRPVVRRRGLPRDRERARRRCARYAGSCGCAGCSPAQGVLERAEIALPGDRRQAHLTAVREAVPEGVNRRVGEAKRRQRTAIEKTAADMIVPFARFDESLGLFHRAFDSRGLDYAVWGHISDGNVHPNVIPATMEDVVRGGRPSCECGRAIVSLGGCPLAEHGVGRNPVKQALLRQLYGAEGIAEMRAVKAALDPEGKLAPGVLFPAVET